MSALQKQLHDMYLDWVNNFLTYEVMSRHYGISVECLSAMIEEGRKIYDDTL
jgi:hypothetical protein